MMSIKGKIIRIRASKGAWASCVITTDEGKDLNCAGTLPGITEGMRVTLTGDYTNHPKYGLQFSVTQCEIEIAYTREYAERYLKSGAVRGIGPETASKIVAKFGDDTMRIFEDGEFEKLTQVDGIGPVTAKKIKQSYNENSAYRKLLGYANLSLAKADALYRVYEEKALDVIKNTPYKIVYEVEGFGFKTVDEIALKNGWREDHPDRIAAAISYLLTKIGDEGHCYCSVEGLEENLNALIPTIDNEQRSEIIYEEIENNHIVIEDDGAVYSKRLFEAEDNIARNIAKMLKENFGELSQRKIDRAIQQMEEEVGFELEYHQKEAVSVSLKNRVSIITGGPGTGKSTIINAIVKGWLSNYPKYIDPLECIVLCAPTGKASRRMSEVTGLFAETVQRILVKQKNGDEKIENKLIIVDESSMLDILLADALVKLAERGNNRIVFIGDVNQLPPIGPGNFFRDLVESPCVPSITLQLCHRQSGTIATNAKRINDGSGFQALNFNDPSCSFIFADRDKARQTVIDAYLELLEKYGLRDTCVIVPMRKSGRSQTSADDLNVLLREEVNPIMEDTVEMEGCKFRVGDRVMVTANDYDKGIFNGDCGIVYSLDPDNGILLLEMDDRRIIELTAPGIRSLTFAYAITCHKAQGSEYKGVVIAHNREHAFMLQRNLLYTAITRAKKEVIIVGEPTALNLAMKKIPSFSRQTKLKIRLAKYTVSN